MLLVSTEPPSLHLLLPHHLYSLEGRRNGREARTQVPQPEFQAPELAAGVHVTPGPLSCFKASETPTPDDQQAMGHHSFLRGHFSW